MQPPAPGGVGRPAALRTFGWRVTKQSNVNAARDAMPRSDPAELNLPNDGHPWGTRGTTPASIAVGLEFEDIVHRYADIEAVSGVSLAIQPGEIVCLVGQSGCGKTTLLRLAAGLERPASGRVLMDGREMAGPRTFLAPERRGVGLMFQDYALFPHMSVMDNVLFGLKALSRADAVQEGGRALARVGLSGHARDYPHRLSGGEQQRVALARAIAPRPGVILMDEPFSNLDRGLREAVRDQTLTVMKETRATAIIVTHDPEEALRLGDRIALMRGGRLVQVGTPRDIYQRPVDLFAARFFSDLNEIPGLIRNGMADTPVGLFAAPGHPEGTSVTVCLRPQAISLRPPGLCLPGRVLMSRFLGEVDLVTIAVPGLDQPLKARIRATGQPVKAGDVGLEINPQEVLVFAGVDP
jgi:iron(III) transport system ATP-binding protein